MEQAIIITLADALFSALNLSQLVHYARVNTPQVEATEGDAELAKVCHALQALAAWSPELYKCAMVG